MEPETEQLITSFKESNKSLRKRATMMGVLMIITISLIFSEKVNRKEVDESVGYLYKLKEIIMLPDSSFISAVDKDFMDYFSIDDDDGFYGLWDLKDEIKLDGYKKDLMQKEINSINEKLDVLHAEKSIGILGLTVPIEPVAYLSLVFVLLLFHDFTQTIIYRSQVHRMLRRRKVAHWKLGFEIFGFNNITGSAELKFIKFTSSLITAVLIICPLITSFLMLDFNRRDSALLGILNIICFLLIIIDTTIILYVENVVNFRYWSNLYLGRYNQSKRKMRIIWLTSIGIIALMNTVIYMLIRTDSFFYNIVPLLISFVPLFFLYLFMDTPHENRASRSLRSVTLVFNVFWIYGTIYNALTIDFWRWFHFELLIGSFVFGFIGSVVISAIYYNFFMTAGKRNLN